MRLKIRGSHLTCNVKKKHPNVQERVEVAEMNKDGPLFSPAVLWIVSVWKKILTQKNIYSQRKDGGCCQDRGYVKI